MCPFEVCENDTLGGGTGWDNASWAMYDEGSWQGVYAHIPAGIAGLKVGGEIDCSGLGPVIEFNAFEDLEGSQHSDALYGDAGINRLVGRATPDVLRAYDGSDRINANAADDDFVFCGAGSFDGAVIDFPVFGTTGWTETAIRR